MKTKIGGMVLFLAAAAMTGAAWGQECAVCGGTEPGSCAACANDFAASCESPCVPACGAAGICGLEYNGYLNAGGTFNDHGTVYNFTHANSDNTLGLDGAYASVLKKAQNGCGCVDWGFGADVMFGRDAKFFSSYKGWDDDWETGHYGTEYFNNSESYGFAAPQLYGEMSANYWTFKAGRFYTLMGYEGARADQRFFYTFGRNFEMTPITHSGALATYSGFENLDFSIGWVAGENNMFERGADESLVTGAVQFQRCEGTSLKYSFVAGDGMHAGAKGTLFRNDVVLKKKLNCCWDTAFIFNYGSLTDAEATGYLPGETQYTGTMNELAKFMAPGGQLEYQTWAGYLFYTLNDCWKFGGRLEWQKGWNSFRGFEYANMEFVSMSFGAHWTPLCCDNFVIRPEFRYDTCSENVFGRNNLNDRGLDDQISLGCDVMYTF